MYLGELYYIAWKKRLNAKKEDHEDSPTDGEAPDRLTSRGAGKLREDAIEWLERYVRCFEACLGQQAWSADKARRLLADLFSPKVMSTSTNPPKGMEIIWKIVTPSELTVWKTAGVVLGSDLDKADGFIHSSNGAMVKNVARLFFSDRGDCLLLKMVPEMWDRTVMWSDEEPEGKKPPTDDGVVIHYLNDGCSHVFTAQPLPMSVVLDEIAMPLGEGGAHVFPVGV